MKKQLIKLSKTTVMLSVAILTAAYLFTACQEQPVSNNNEKEKVVAEDLEDMGKKPWALDIEQATIDNNNYRKAIWTGEYMQVVLMSLKPGEIIDLEVHHNHDQFFRVDQGKGRIYMGKTEDDLYYEKVVKDDWAIFVPAGYWHKLENTGDVDLKVYTIYAPPEHAHGTINKTYDEAKEYHHHHEH